MATRTDWRWVSEFCDTYATHAAVLGALSQAQVVGWDAWENGLVHRSGSPTP